MIDSNAAAKKATIEWNKAAYCLWPSVHKELEAAVIRDALSRPHLQGRLICCSSRRSNLTDHCTRCVSSVIVRTPQQLPGHF